MNTDSTQTTIQNMLTTTPPAFSMAEAASVAADHYGIDATVHPLVSERDQNFRLDAHGGKRYTLKFSNDAEQLQVIDFQNRALVYIENHDASLPLPRVVPDLEGHLHCSVRKDDKTHFVRVLSWVDGMVLHDTQANADLANRLGRLLARLGLALDGFEHPGSNPPLLWDMKRAAALRDLLIYIEEPELRQLATQTLDQFDSTVKPALEILRTQVIHSDLNPGNVLMSKTQPDEISGIIDFGDMVKSPLIIDLAIALSYQLSSDDDPLAGALPMIAGYHTVRPLKHAEMEILTDLIRTRLITTLLINSYRVTLFPENRDYLMISYDSARNFLINLNRLSADDAVERILAACA
ncbi:MAG: phosphotransferase [Gammaproteobacteria bacterium]|nr:phosphotransferase [Gammaproteobacteria bacterium]